METYVRELRKHGVTRTWRARRAGWRRCAGRAGQLPADLVALRPRCNVPNSSSTSNYEAVGLHDTPTTRYTLNEPSMEFATILAITMLLKRSQKIFLTLV
ncbi:unnamed protein product [Parnassius apollo]|uniref:(apollo) hypothetical protein n=1 Tax=Parnassius apollo TaxID=110799 RepID=A0A8S3W6F8_PARAO|nr:unnamed protein product [Parnassius apollo]